MGQHAAAHTSQDHQERELIAGIRNGDAAAMGRLFDRYAPALLGVISRIITDRHTAESLLQGVFLRIREELPTYDPSKIRLFTWMLGIARKAALDTLAFPPQLEIRDAGKNVSNTAAIDLVYLHGYSLTRAAQALGLSTEDLVKQIRMELTNLRATK